MVKNSIKFKKNHSQLIGVVAAILAVTAFLSIAATAWFSHRRSLAIMAEVTEPDNLSIRAGNTDDLFNLDLSEIDVKGEKKQQRYVFTVCNEEQPLSDYRYIIQLAHTTNIPFTYKIYKATKGGDVGADKTVVYKNKQTSEETNYTLGALISGEYLNPENFIAGGIANDTLHSQTYENYSTSNVQENAEPVYWQSIDIAPAVLESGNSTNSDYQNGTYKFIDYYILEISWDGVEIVNDKETDMIYITAGKSSS